MSGSSVVSICLLYPDLLGTYGDGGNSMVLAGRLQWRGIATEIVPVGMGDDIPERCDVYVMGGGEDQPQTLVTQHLAASRALHRAVDNGATVLAVCAGMQVLGNSFAVSGGKVRSGLGLLDITTSRGHDSRSVGEITVRPSELFGDEMLSGYENHGGSTTLGSGAMPLGTVVAGRGNDDGSGTEGAVSGRVVGTYLHGPVLARNPQLADKVLSWVVGDELEPLDDVEIEELRSERFAAADRLTKRSGRLATLRNRVASLKGR